MKSYIKTKNLLRKINSRLLLIKLILMISSNRPAPKSPKHSKSKTKALKPEYSKISTRYKEKTQLLIF